MIPRSAKLPLRTDYFSFKKTSTKTSNDYFTLHYKKEDPSRVAVVVSKKVASLASSRNKIKRTALDSLYDASKSNGISALLIFRKPAPPSKIKTLINDLLKDLNVS